MQRCIQPAAYYRSIENNLTILLSFAKAKAAHMHAKGIAAFQKQGGTDYVNGSTTQFAGDEFQQNAWHDNKRTIQIHREIILWL